MDQLEQTDRLVTCSGIHKTNRSSGIHRQTGRQQAAMKVTRIKKENVDTDQSSIQTYTHTHLFLCADNGVCADRLLIAGVQGQEGRGSYPQPPGQQPPDPGKPPHPGKTRTSTAWSTASTPR